MTLCANMAVIKAAVIETSIIMETCRVGIQAMRQRHVEGEEIVNVKSHGGQVIGGVGEGHLRCVVLHGSVKEGYGLKRAVIHRRW